MTRDLRHLDSPEFRTIVTDQPYPLLFATVSGAHLYGFRCSTRSGCCSRAST